MCVENIFSTHIIINDNKKGEDEMKNKHYYLTLLAKKEFKKLRKKDELNTGVSGSVQSTYIKQIHYTDENAVVKTSLAFSTCHDDNLRPSFYDVVCLILRERLTTRQATDIATIINHYASRKFDPINIDIEIYEKYASEIIRFMSNTLPILTRTDEIGTGIREIYEKMYKSMCSNPDTLAHEKYIGNTSSTREFIIKIIKELKYTPGCYIDAYINTIESLDDNFSISCEKFQEILDYALNAFNDTMSSNIADYASMFGLELDEETERYNIRADIVNSCTVSDFKAQVFYHVAKSLLRTDDTDHNPDSASEEISKLKELNDTLTNRLKYLENAQNLNKLYQFGTKTIFTKKQMRSIIALHDGGLTWAEIAERFCVSPNLMKRVVGEYRKYEANEKQ